MKKRLEILIFTIIIITSSIDVHAEMLTNTYKIAPTTRCSIDINATNDILVMQGISFFERNNTNYAVYAGFKSDTDNTILTLVNIDTCEVISTNKSKILGHANDLTYNSKTKEFYVTTSPNKLDGEYFVDRFIITDDNNIEFVDNGEIKGAAITAGFAYIEETDDFFTYTNGRFRRIKVLIDENNNKRLSITKTIKEGLKTYYDGVEFENVENDNEGKRIYFVNKEDDISGYAKFVNQGIAYYNNSIYSARALNGTKQTTDPAIQRQINSAYTYEQGGEIKGYDNDSAYILIYDADTGNYRYSLYIPKTLFEGHLEGVSIVNDKLMLSYNVHSATPKHVSFLEYNLKRKISYYLYDKTNETTPTKIGESTCIFGEKCQLKSFEELSNDFSLSNETKFIGWSTNKKDIEYIDGQTFTTNTSNDINLYTIIQENNLEKGDMNLNNRIDIKDIILLIKKYLKTLEITGNDLYLGDMNDNGKIDIKDIILLINTYLINS